MRGYRVDVSTDGGAWRSLCSRVGAYRLVDGSGAVVRELDPITDEGYVKSTSATSAEGDGKPLYVHEALARWTGWSLTVPRPGRTLEPQVEQPPPPGDYERPALPRSDATTEFRLETTFEPKPGTLPRLRFGAQLPGAGHVRRSRRRAAGAGRGGGRDLERDRPPPLRAGAAAGGARHARLLARRVARAARRAQRLRPRQRHLRPAGDGRRRAGIARPSRPSPVPAEGRPADGGAARQARPRVRRRVAIPTPATGSRCASRGRSATRR